MKPDQEQLAGGLANAGNVVRVGEFVYRPAPANAATIHSLLDYLSDLSFTAPRPVSLDEGQETLSYIPGAVPVAPYPDWAQSDEVLAAVGSLLREFHTATAGFVQPADAVWSQELADPRGGALVCHNDVCLENVVFQNGTAVALLDFDFAAPGRPVWDLVMTARFWVPLTSPAAAASLGWLEVDPFARARILADAYNLTMDDRRRFPAVLMEIEHIALQFVLTRIDRGERAFADSWFGGGKERYALKMSWLERNLPRLGKALQ